MKRHCDLDGHRATLASLVLRSVMFTASQVLRTWV